MVLTFILILNNVYTIQIKEFTKNSNVTWVHFIFVRGWKYWDLLRSLSRVITVDDCLKATDGKTQKTTKI